MFHFSARDAKLRCFAGDDGSSTSRDALEKGSEGESSNAMAASHRNEQCVGGLDLLGIMVKLGAVEIAESMSMWFLLLLLHVDRSECR